MQVQRTPTSRLRSCSSLGFSTCTVEPLEPRAYFAGISSAGPERFPVDERASTTTTHRGADAVISSESRFVSLSANNASTFPSAAAAGADTDAAAGADITLTPTVSARLPTNVVGGTKAKGARVSIAVANSGTADFDGRVTINLSVSPDDTLDDADKALGVPVVKKLKLKAGATSKPVKIRLGEFPDTLPDGVYRILAQASAEGASAGTGASLTEIHVSRPVIQLNPEVSTDFPAPLVVGQKPRGRIILRITNSGTVASTGLTFITINASTNPGVPGGVTLATIRKPLTIPPRETRKVIIKLKAVPSVPEGDYFILAQVSDASSDVIMLGASGNTVHISG